MIPKCLAFLATNHNRFFWIFYFYDASVIFIGSKIAESSVNFSDAFHLFSLVYKKYHRSGRAIFFVNSGMILTSCNLFFRDIINYRHIVSTRYMVALWSVKKLFNTWEFVHKVQKVSSYSNTQWLFLV